MTEVAAMARLGQRRPALIVPLALVAALLLSAASGADVEPLAPGARLPELTLADQHDVSAVIGPDVRMVVFTRDMDGADIVKEALAENGAVLLANAQAVYVADISRMPAVITKLFALPAMRKRPYRMLLDRDGTLSARFPSVDGKATVMFLDQLTIQRVEHVDSAAALRAQLQRAAEIPAHNTPTAG